MGDVGREQKGEGSMKEGGGKEVREGDWEGLCQAGWAEGPSPLWASVSSSVQWLVQDADL